MEFTAQSLSAWAASASAIVGVASALFAYQAQRDSAAATRQLTEQEIKLKEVQAQISSNADIRADRESTHKIDQFVYGEVIALFKLPDSTAADARRRHELAVSGIVNTMASDQVRVPLANALAFQIKSPELRDDAIKAADYFRAEAQVRQNSPEPGKPSTIATAGDKKVASALSSFRIDAFYCEGEPNTARAKAYVEGLVNRMNNVGTQGSWRVRTMPSNINAIPGYGVSRSEIRFNPQDDETAAAHSLKKAVEDEFSKTEAEKIAFALVQVGQRSKSYLSLFVCGLK